MGVLEENWNNRGLFLLCECFLSFRGFSVLLSVDRGNLWIAVRRIGIVELFLNQRMLLFIFFISSVCSSWKFVNSCVLRRIGIVEVCFIMNASCHFMVFQFFFLYLSVSWKFVDSCEKNWNSRALFLFEWTNASCHFVVLHFFCLSIEICW